MDEKIDILLSRYFSGEASRQELAKLDKWLAESAENEAYFDNMTMLYQQLAFTTVDSPEFNTEEALNDFKTYMRKNETPKKKTFRLAPYIRVAAAMAVLMIGLFAFFIFRDNSQVIQLATTDTTQEYTLQNDIMVSLAPQSEIEYSEKDKDNVKLKGKATFSIEGDTEQKFVVQAGETFVRHIGTIFTVSAYDADEAISVEVHEGEVVFYTELNEGVHVRQNEIALYNSYTREFSYLTEQQTYEELIFNATPLYEVINKLESYYNVHIVLVSPRFEGMRISASFAANEPIEDVLEVITETLSLSVSQSGNSFIISQ